MTPAYAPQDTYLKDGDPNPFRLDETRVSGQRLAADFSNLVQAYMTSNSGSVQPANHQVGTVWFDTSRGRLYVCAVKANPTATPSIDAVWNPISGTTTAVADPASFVHKFVRGLYALENATDISNANGCVFGLLANDPSTPTMTNFPTQFSINAVGASGEHFYVSNNSGVPARLVFDNDTHVRADGAFVERVSRGGGTGEFATPLVEFEQITMRNGEMWLLKAQDSPSTGFGPTQWVATLFRYAPANLRPASQAGARSFYTILTTIEALRAAGPGNPVIFATNGIAAAENIATDSSGGALEASGSVRYTTIETTTNNSVLIFLSPVRITRLENRGFNGLDTLSSFDASNVELLVGSENGPQVLFYVYISRDLLRGVSFDFNIQFEETA